VIEGEYLRDILDQPRALERTLGGLQESKPLAHLKERLQKGQFKNVVLTGMGSSFHALHPLNLGLIEHGFASLMVETSELVHYQARLVNSENLLVVVSQSGESAETVRLLEVNQSSAPIIAVTNTANSPLSERVDATVLTQAGKEFSVSCKTYVAALMALSWLESLLCGFDLRAAREELHKSISATASYLAGWKGHVQCLAESLKGIRDLFLVGRGPSLAATGTGALIVKESAHFPAESMSSAAFRHGPFEMLSEETFVLVFAGSSRTRNLNQRLVQDIREHQGRAELVEDNSILAPFTLPSAPSRLQPILEILPVQMITLALAAQTGREAGRFERASKVTTTE
jgi:glucosamine--fructose-6-phosphate aminotransferase (isomerizing)